ncbi:MAG: hypothetical protein LC130_21700 [Bryobacterales bacterium]|nr:hypothetical protein [Bryobacterales bacterium]
MKRIWMVLLALPLAAQIVPNRYIVELNGEPAATYSAKTKGNLRAALADRPGWKRAERIARAPARTCFSSWRAAS